ncbi:MAG TPA: protein kinase [Candidatus Sulfotelmatobacter sp.]|nr:protein kinase [Candidatus Sulfotelmatobacter sp.]
METEKLCPNCRKPLPPDVPLGLCPECLIKSGFPTESEPGTGAGGIGRFVPPPVEEIARLFPQFEILGFIGKGGMGAVYKARQTTLDRLVALKVLPPAVASDPGFAERFNREARALARLSHPNIVAVYDFGKAGPLHYLVMEFVDGTNLRQVEQAGRLSAEQALAIVPQICEALQFAHNEGIVHRDIKPENLLLDKKGRIKITDFGIAKILDVSSGKAALTGAKDVVGTPHYMAPEQVEKPQAVDHRADIYSLGVVFYEMLTGELPLGKFAPPSKKVQVDVRLDEVVLHTLEKEPERRYQQASQVKTDVETIAGTPPPIAGAPISRAAPPVGSAPPTEPASDKIILPAFLLAFCFGVFGAHRFYVGKIGTAIAQLFTFGGFGIWATIDWILILCKVFTDANGRRLTNWWHPYTGPPKPAKPPRPPAPPVIGGNLFGETFGGAAPMIIAPAVALMVAGFIKLFEGLVALFVGWPLEKTLFSDTGLFPFTGPQETGVILLFVVVPAAVMIYGATEMMRCRNHAWAVAASIVAIVFCSLLGCPAGIWALIVLLQPGVRDSFSNSSAPIGHENWLKILGGSAVAGLLLFLVLCVSGFLHHFDPGAAYRHYRGPPAAVAWQPPRLQQPQQPQSPLQPMQPQPQQPTPNHDQRRILQSELIRAQLELRHTETRRNSGTASSEDVDAARLKVDILEAEMAQLAGNTDEAAKFEAETAALKSKLLAEVTRDKSAQATAPQTNAQATPTSRAIPVASVSIGASPLSYQWYDASNLPGSSSNLNPYTVQTNVRGAVSTSPPPANSNPDPDPIHKTVEAGDSTDVSTSFDVAPRGELTVNVDRGSVSITAADQNTVTIHLTRDVTGASDSESRQILKDEHVKFIQTGPQISITADTPPELQHMSLFHHANLDAQYEITVPRKFDAHVETMGGDVNVTDLQGSADIQTMGGSLGCKDIGGDLKAKTMGGDVRAGGCKGRMDLQTMGGSIAIDGFTGPSVDAVTSGGSVSAEFIAAPTADSELRTMGGNVTVWLPDNAALQLEGQTFGGSARSDFPVQIKNGFGNDTLSGPINGGGPLLKMDTAGGNVEVYRRNLR